jgi:hypothetical protein
LFNRRSSVAGRERISPDVASSTRLEQATAAYFEGLPADVACEELELAIALDAWTNEGDFQDGACGTDLPTQ